jgi:hypothetical protein
MTTGEYFMKAALIATYGLLLLVIGGCSSHHPTQLGGSDRKMTDKKVVASSLEDFEAQAVRLCPFGYDILYEPLSFDQGAKSSRFIRCKLQR